MMKKKWLIKFSLQFSFLPFLSIIKVLCIAGERWCFNWSVHVCTFKCVANVLVVGRVNGLQSIGCCIGSDMLAHVLAWLDSLPLQTEPKERTTGIDYSWYWKIKLSFTSFAVNYHCQTNPSMHQYHQQTLILCKYPHYPNLEWNKRPITKKS